MQKQSLDSTEIRRLIMFGILFATAVYLVVIFVSGVEIVVLLFSLVALITFVLSPLVTWLERHKIPRYISAISVMLIVFGILGLLIWFTYPIVARQFSQLFAEMPQYAKSVHNWLADHLSFLGFKRSSSSSTLGSGVFSQSAGSWLTRIGKYTFTLVESIAGILIVIISTIYALAMPRQLLEGFFRLLKPDMVGKASHVLNVLATQQRRWAWATLVGMFTIFLLTWIALGLILHMPYAFLFAVIAGVFEIVPTVGPIIASIPPALIALAIDPKLLIWVLVAFLIIHQIENHIVVPMVLGRGAHIHPVSVIFMVAMLGGVYGVIGIFLAVPAAVTIKVLVDELYIKPHGHDKENLQRRVEPIVSFQSPDEDEFTG